MRTYLYTKKPIGHNHTSPPDSFLDALIEWGRQEDESVFAPNLKNDIYGYLRPVLAPPPLGWTSMLHRRAAMLEALRVIGGDESDWNWREGRDTTAKLTAPENQEVGAFQVSYDSRRLGSDLGPFLAQHGITDAQTFQDRIKADPMLDMAYTARLLRDSTKWDGPLNRQWVREQVSTDAVDEFMRFLA